MAKVQWNPGALLAPVPPTLVSCGTVEQPNVLTVAWTGILNTKPPKTYISIRPQRHSYPLIAQSGEFVINLPTADLVRAVDFCGVRSGAKVDKFAQMGLTPLPAAEVSAPLVAECPIHLECRITDRLELGSHHMFLADIVKVQVEERFLDPRTGALDIAACNLLAYAHGSYFALGKQLGTFGYSVRKKPPAKAAGKAGRRPRGAKASKHAVPNRNTHS